MSLQHLEPATTTVIQISRWSRVILKKKKEKWRSYLIRKKKNPVLVGLFAFYSVEPVFLSFLNYDEIVVIQYLPYSTLVDTRS